MNHNQYIVGGAFLPASPILAHDTGFAAHQQLKEQIKAMEKKFESAGAQRIVYYSTAWLSVLGVSVQGRAQLKGTHVDENWHDLGDLKFDFKVDRKFAEGLTERLKSNKYAASLIDYQGFPVDSQTIVADQLLNHRQLPVSMISSHVYADHQNTVKHGEIVAEAIAHDQVPTAVVALSHLSCSFFGKPIDWQDDHVSEPVEDEHNKALLDHLTAKRAEEFWQEISDYSKLGRLDMGLKGFSFLSGALGEGMFQNPTLKAYGPLYGAAGAVIDFI
jgi:2-aminophenol/2-amino-5-chlorophenol 1,6-dioxygenase subunit alpha